VKGYHGSVECQLFPSEYFFVRIQPIVESNAAGKKRISGWVVGDLLSEDIMEKNIGLSVDSLAYGIYSW
jgi:hypothetical protein